MEKTNLKDLGPEDFRLFIYFRYKSSLVGLNQILNTVNQFVPVRFSLTRDRFSEAARTRYPFIKMIYFLFPIMHQMTLGLTHRKK